MARNPKLKTEAFVKWFRSATPYIHRWGGATFVIAFGGEVLEDARDVFTHAIYGTSAFTYSKSSFPYSQPIRWIQ